MGTDKTVEETAQLSAKPLLAVMVALGAVVFDVITALAPAVHPLAPVTVTE